MDIFQFLNKEIKVFTDFYEATGIDWRIDIPQDNGTVKRYTLSYPTPEGAKIRVAYTPSILLNGVTMQTQPTDRYYTSDLPIFYHMPVSGPLAAKHAVNGLVRRLSEFRGNKETADGYLIYDDGGNLVQPVVFDVAITPESVDGASDGAINITLHNANGAVQYRLNNGVYGNSSSFTGLSSGTYTVYVKDTAGTERFQKVYVYTS